MTLLYRLVNRPAPPARDLVSRKGDHESVTFARKAAHPSELIALGPLIGGGQGDVPQVLKGIVQSAGLWACFSVGFQHEQS